MRFPLSKKHDDTNFNILGSDTIRMFGSCAALIFFFLIYGILQERIMTMPFGPNEEMFTYSAFLIFNNRIVVVLVAFCLLKSKQEAIGNAAPLHKYFYISFSNTLATFCQYESLRYISFPTQTIGRCGKMIPVMLISGLLGLKKYQLRDYGAALSVSFGCVLFLLAGDTAPQSGRTTDSTYGVILVIGYLFFDGFTSTFQEKLFKDYTISINNQMLYVNLTSALLCFLYLLVSDQLLESVSFSILYPASYVSALSLSLAACGSQFLTFHILKNFGALVFSIAMIFRHIIAIALSCILFFHPLTPYQWIAVVIVLGTFYLHSTKRPLKGDDLGDKVKSKEKEKEEAGDVEV